MKNFLKLIGVIIVIAVLVLSLSRCFQNEPAPAPPSPTPPPTEPTPSPTPSPTEPSPTPTPSPTEILVNIVIYTDFSCGSCARLHFEVEKELLELYVKTGKAKLSYYLLAVVEPESVPAAQAALCANEQGRVWDYRDAILTAWQESGKPAYSEEHLRNTAEELGLDMTAFDACLSNPAAILEKLQQSLQKSQEAGIDEVPVVFINDVRIDGIQPLETYVTAIEEQLAE